MKKEKNNVKSKKTKKYKISKIRLIIVIAIICIIVSSVISMVKYLNSEKYKKRKIERLVVSWAEEYYKKEFADIASSYIKDKAEKGESITINLNLLEKFGKDISLIKNDKYNRKCNDIDTYVSIKVDKNAKNIKKDYKVEKVVLDCFR